MKKSYLLLIITLFVFALSAKAQKSESLKIISYNIWNGFDWGKDEVRRSELVSWVKEQNPTIVGLQELCKYSDEKLKEDAKKWGHQYSVLLKQSGYSVGLTSEYPIETIEKIRDGMHHGALHCRTAGMDVFVIHFSPGSYKKRREEAKIILHKLEKVAKNNSKFLIMGDFNALSPFDADLYKDDVLLNRYRKSNADKPENGNLVDNEFDFTVLSKFLAFPLIDAFQKFTNGIAERGSFPGRVLGKINNETENDLITRMERIDYILLSPELAKKCISAEVGNKADNWYLSDHYPVITEIKFK
jgi:exodeoxyribonuclease-3